MNLLYRKPTLRSYSAEKVCEIIGPVQAASVELYIQSVPFSFNTNKAKTERIVYVQKIDKGIVYINKTKTC